MSIIKEKKQKFKLFKYPKIRLFIVSLLGEKEWVKETKKRIDYLNKILKLEWEEKNKKPDITPKGIGVYKLSPREEEIINDIDYFFISSKYQMEIVNKKDDIYKLNFKVENDLKKFKENNINKFFNKRRF